MNYEMVPLNGQGQFDLNGVRFNNRQSTFTYWKRKSIGNTDIKGVMVIFDDKYANMQLSSNVMVISLKGLTNYNELVMAMRIFKDILRKQNIDVLFHFVVSNEEERQVAEALARDVGIKCDISVVNQKDVKKKDDDISKLEENLERKREDRDINANGSKTIETNNNGVNKKITINGDKAYENTGLLSIDEEKYLLLQEWKNDPYKSGLIANKTAEEIDRMLLETVTLNRKKYEMTSAIDQVAVDDASRVAMKKAGQEDGRVNSELGIVENGVYNNNQYSAVERDGDMVRMVNPSVANININSGGVTGDSSEASIEESYTESDIKEIDEKSRKVFDENKVYYIDEEYNISEIVEDREVLRGKVGYNGYSYDSVNNIIMKDGRPEAYVGDRKDLDKQKNDVQAKPMVRTLKKDNDNRGFATLPVVMFIISALLLIGSVVLLFVLS